MSYLELNMQVKRETIEDSYDIVADELADNEKALDYYTAMRPTRELVGTQFARWNKQKSR
jgi:hypothetical protein